MLTAISQSETIHLKTMMSHVKRRTLLYSLGASISLAWPRSLSSASAYSPEEANLTVRHRSEVRTFSLSELDALHQSSFATTTIWTEGVVEFSGPTLARLLASMNIPRGPLRLRAANNYLLTLDAALIEPEAPLLATRMDGQTFGLRDRGPIWLVFPYDASSRFRTESVFAASVWQIVEIVADENS